MYDGCAYICGILCKRENAKCHVGLEWRFFLKFLIFYFITKEKCKKNVRTSEYPAESNVRALNIDQARKEQPPISSYFFL